MGPFLKFCIHINDCMKKNLINWSVKEPRLHARSEAGRLNGSHNTSCIWIGRTTTPFTQSCSIIPHRVPAPLLLFSLVFNSPILSLEQQSSGGPAVVLRLGGPPVPIHQSPWRLLRRPLRHARQTWPPVRPYIKRGFHMITQKPRWKKCRWECQGRPISQEFRVNIKLFDVGYIRNRLPQTSGIVEPAGEESGCGFCKLFPNLGYPELKYSWLASSHATLARPKPRSKVPPPQKKKIHNSHWWKPFQDTEYVSTFFPYWLFFQQLWFLLEQVDIHLQGIDQIPSSSEAETYVWIIRNRSSKRSDKHDYSSDI